MLLPGQENVHRLNVAPEGVERIARLRLEKAESLVDIVDELDRIESLPAGSSEFKADEMIERLTMLMAVLDDPETDSKSQVFDLRDFTRRLGLRKAIGSVLRAKGFRVTEDVFVDYL
jgi:ribosome assembly protein YihI (activator of Der GTPase)